MHPEFAPIAFIAAFSLVLPLPWHWRAGNIATLSMIIWLFLSNMIFAIDAVIWAGNVDIVATAWCDITTKIIIGANFALPAACLCISMHLEQVSSLRTTQSTIADKRRRQYFEASFCFGLPMIFMALHYIVQGHRFDIIEDYGCRPATYFSIPAIFIIWIPPLIMATGALICGGLALRHFMMRRLTFAAHLNSNNSALTTSRYLRLMVMSVLQMVWSITVTGYALWFTIQAIPIRTWTTWADVHSNFSRIDLFPTFFTPPFVARAFYVLWWMVPASTFLFVGFFSFGKDAMDEYKKCFSWLKTRVFRLPAAKTNLKNISLPFVRKDPGSPSSKTFGSSDGGAMITMLSMSSASKGFDSPAFLDKPTSFDRSDTISETSHYTLHSPLRYKEPRAVGSISDLSVPETPSTAAPDYSNVIDIKRPEPLEPPSPITPPPSHPRFQRPSKGRPPVSPRPLTYPSSDASHQRIKKPMLGRL